MINFRIVKDKNGYLRAHIDNSYGPLVWYLEQDVQSDVHHCQWILEICSRIKTEGGTWSGTGNAHSVTIAQDKVFIENQYVEGKTGTCELGLDAFTKAISSWLQAIQGDAG